MLPLVVSRRSRPIPLFISDSPVSPEPQRHTGICKARQQHLWRQRSRSLARSTRTASWTSSSRRLSLTTITPPSRLFATSYASKILRGKYIRFTFELPPNTASLLPIASCVVIKTAPAQEDPAHPPLLDSKGKPFVRPYTPISESTHPEEITFLIKKYDTGKVTPYLHDMKPGQTIGIKGPFPKTPYQGP